MLLNIFSVLVIIHIFYYFALKTNKFALMDVCWGLGITLVAVVAFLQNIATKPKILLLFMVLAWGLRLSYHIWKRLEGHSEDFRYAKLKQEWGADYKKQGYIKVFLLQGFLIFIVSLPVQLGMSGLWDDFGFKKYLGFLIWVLGFSLEVWADEHLKRFKADTSNYKKLCFTGPWKICRFPNFLGEMMMWWGIYLYILNFWSSWTIVGPITLTYFMIKVTGIPMLEEKFSQNPLYLDYMKKVPRLIPINLERIKNYVPKKFQV